MSLYSTMVGPYHRSGAENWRVVVGHFYGTNNMWKYKQNVRPSTNKTQTGATKHTRRGKNNNNPRV